MVLCNHCTHLLCLRKLQPLCVATAEAIPGPLRELVDVKGVVMAELRNQYNDCNLFHRKVLVDRSAKIKRALVGMMKSKGLNVEPASLEEYTVGQERDFVKEAFRLRDRQGEGREEAKQRTEEPWRLEGADLGSIDSIRVSEGEGELPHQVFAPATQEELGDAPEATEGDEEVDSSDANSDDLLGLSGSGRSGGEDEDSGDSGGDGEPGVSGDDEPDSPST